MANQYVNSSPVPVTTRHPAAAQLLPLFELISRLCPPRSDIDDSGVCRLIVDGRLDWSLTEINGHSWLYLPQAVPMRQLAGCTVLLAA